jgi:hypothetical protein
VLYVFVCADYARIVDLFCPRAAVDEGDRWSNVQGAGPGSIAEGGGKAPTPSSSSRPSAALIGPDSAGGLEDEDEDVVVAKGRTSASPHRASAAARADGVGRRSQARMRSSSMSGVYPVRPSSSYRFSHQFEPTANFGAGEDEDKEAKAALGLPTTDLDVAGGPRQSAFTDASGQSVTMLEGGSDPIDRSTIDFGFEVCWRCIHPPTSSHSLSSCCCGRSH